MSVFEIFFQVTRTTGALLQHWLSNRSMISSTDSLVLHAILSMEGFCIAF